MEFFTLASQELLREDLGMWRDDQQPPQESKAGAVSSQEWVTESRSTLSRVVGDGVEISADMRNEGSATPGHRSVSAPVGVFPRPLSSQCSPKAESVMKDRVVSLFEVLGRLVGKALVDGRLLDIPFSLPFCSVLCGDTITNSDLYLIDPSLHASLGRFQKLVAERDSLIRDGQMEQVEKLGIDGCRIEDLTLYFTMPGYPEIELVPEGGEQQVTIHNLDSYVERVYEMALGEGVKAQFDAFFEGFETVIPKQVLRMFSAEELERILRGDISPFSQAHLRAHMKADHGYSMDSQPVQWLMETMEEMEHGDRRLLLRFLTGSPTLPVGGVAGLRPRLTVVRKDPEAPLTADAYLPSVMTCANYLKLPPYSSKEVLQTQLTKAMKNGQLAFLLS